MVKMIKIRIPVLLVMVWLLVLGGCARLPNIPKTSLTPKTLGELERYLVNYNAQLDLFRSSGPFAVQTHEDVSLQVSATERIDADLYLSGHTEKAPLVVFMHGFGTWKEAHAYQAMHVASWGMHGLTVQLPNEGPWMGNGRLLARVVNTIHGQPALFGGRVDVDRIILVGHSFGGAAVAIALADGARASGGILLDPAGVGRELPTYLRRLDKPLLLLGADEQMFAARNRDYFYRYVRRRIAEVSIKDATHEDGQFPADTGQATEELQITFVGAVTLAAFSLALTRQFDYAWTNFREELASGRLIKAKKK
jgi:pimeloyl-ACP methyl ester carboxylesterase